MVGLLVMCVTTDDVRAVVSGRAKIKPVQRQVHSIVLTFVPKVFAGLQISMRRVRKGGRELEPNSVSARPPAHGSRR